MMGRGGGGGGGGGGVSSSLIADLWGEKNGRKGGAVID